MLVPPAGHRKSDISKLWAVSIAGGYFKAAITCVRRIIDVTGSYFWLHVLGYLEMIDVPC